MKNYDLYARLELLAPAQQVPANSSQTGHSQRWAATKKRLSQAGQSLLRSLAGSREPRITVRRDRQGNPYFVAYDPVDGQQQTFASEAEVRIWLDQRYYQ